MKTDFGNYWFNKTALEIPYNSRVDVLFYFTDVSQVSLGLDFNYLGKNWEINTGNIFCFEGERRILAIPELNIIYEIISKISGNGGLGANKFCNMNITFKNLPTYTRYTIKYSFVDDSGNLNEDDTYRIFTPFIKNCSSIGSFSCGSYWTSSNSNSYYTNTFKLVNSEVVTKCFSLGKQCGINYNNRKCYYWKNNKIIINGIRLNKVDILGDC